MSIFLNLIKQIRKKWLILLKTFLINIVKNNIRKLFAGEPHQVVKITVPQCRRYSAHPHPFLQQVSRQIFKDDVNDFPSTSDICFMCSPFTDFQNIFTQRVLYQESFYVTVHDGFVCAKLQQRRIAYIKTQHKSIRAICSLSATLHTYRDQNQLFRSPQRRYLIEGTEGEGIPAMKGSAGLCVYHRVSAETIIVRI